MSKENNAYAMAQAALSSANRALKDIEELQNTGVDTTARAQIAAITNRSIVDVAVDKAIETSDIGKVLAFNSESDLTCTIPTDTELETGIGSIFIVLQMGTGSVTFIADEGVTICSLNSAVSTSGQYGEVIARKVSANTWILTGALTDLTGG
jgi:hypothetical protein